MTSLFILLTPFSYLELYGIRIILLQVLLGGLILLKSALLNEKVSFDITFIYLLFIVMLTFIYSVMSGNQESFFSTFIFVVLFYITYSTVILKHISIDSIKRLYVYITLFSACGLFLQWGLHKFFNITIFRYVLFGGNRNAYSFIWMDFSFISLFVLCSIPIAFSVYSRGPAFIISIFLTIASVITSARTGMGALFLFLFFLILINYIKSLQTFRINKYYFILTIALPVFILLFIFGLPLLTGRIVSTSSSGRIEDYVIALEFFASNPWFGAMLDKIYFSENIAIIPHNLFIYPLALGGITYFIFFIVFLVVLLYAIRKSDKYILYSVYICLLGFLFIPSFFSAYFFAVLLGIALASSKLNIRNNKVTI